MIRSIPILFLLVLSQDPAPAWKQRIEKHSKSPEAWAARKAAIREQILVAAGLWPEFERPALKPVVFGKVEGEGYTVERVNVETWPGFHLTGSLYRPAGKKGPFPGVVSPHGHWKDGRFTMEANGHLPARGITFARFGFVCFMYDMVGYADFKQLPHRYEDAPWGIGLFGLQTWNSLRAVDFLSSLPDVDPKRIGAMGASGGGTQTFILTAIDDRIACAAPVNMVAAEFQGGCSCENAPFLRIDLNNVEIAAATAPRPLLLICCTGDWTKNTPVLEGPGALEAYKNLGVPERIRWVQMQAPHNYNKDSRESVYAWFVRWLQNGPDQPKIEEPALPAVKREDLSVFTGGHKLPEGAVDAEGLKQVLRKAIRDQLAGLWTAEKLGRSQAAMRTALRHSFGARWLDPAGWSVKESKTLSHPDLPRSIEVALRGAGKRRASLVVLRGPEPAALAHADDLTVVLQDEEPAAEAPAGGNDPQRKGFPTCFFRTGLARRVQNVLAVLSYLHSRSDVSEIRLVGLGESGITALFARALVPTDRVSLTIADTAGLIDGGESTWTGARAHPGMRRLGGSRAAAALAAPGRLVLHNMQGRYDPAPVLAAYRAAGKEDALTLAETDWDAARILEALK